MDIFCPACQQRLQIADEHAGQMVKCPSCAAEFQAPSLPSATPLPPEPALAPPGPVPESHVPFSFAADAAAPAAPHVETPRTPERPTKPTPKGEHTRGFTIHLRRQVMTLIPPIGIVILFILSFFPWRHVDATGITKLSLWELAFSGAGSTGFLFYVLLLIVAAPIVILPPFFEKNLLPTPVPLRPYLPWAPVAVVVLTAATWLLFLTYHLHSTFADSIDLTTIWMKLAFRLHTLIVVAAILDLWLERRDRQNLPEPTVAMRW